MRYNVAQLLLEATGAQRRYSFEMQHPDLDPQLELAAPLQGEVLLMRTHDGVLVQARVRTVLRLACVRCLEPMDAAVEAEWSEEFHPSLDVVTGRKLVVDPDDVDQGTLIDEHHILDLTETVRQQLLLQMPTHPLCRDDCQGLCPVCGGNRNLYACNCQDQEVDPRWAALAQALDESDEPESA
ncbi:MAG: DUF177 domain-containing protein [Chloroflexi bacterium]|nr:DUF177 domain-containing protein [Chloroflexota bacterium]